MKTVLNIWTTAFVFTLPVYFITGAILGLLFPTAPENRIPGLFELHLLVSFIFVYVVLLIKKDWANNFIGFFKPH